MACLVLVSMDGVEKDGDRSQRGGGCRATYFNHVRKLGNGTAEKPTKSGRGALGHAN
jgi:hypothetical protein